MEEGIGLFPFTKKLVYAAVRKMVHVGLNAVHAMFCVIWKKNLDFFFFVSIFKKKMVREYCTKLIKPVRQCSTACKSKCLASNFDNRSSAANIYNLCNAIDSSLRMTGQKDAIQRFYDGITIQLGKTMRGIGGHKFIWTNRALKHFRSASRKRINTVFKESEIKQRIADGAYSIVTEASGTYLTIEGVEGTLQKSSQFWYTSSEPERMNAVFLIVKISDDKYEVRHFDAPKSKFITPPPAAPLQ